MRISRSRIAALLPAVLALGLASCLTSDPPNLVPQDLAQPSGFDGSYFATAFPEGAVDKPETVDATMVPAADRSYALTLIEGEHKDQPIRIQLVTLPSGLLLAVMTEPDSPDQAMFAIVTRAANGAWVFRSVELRSDQRSRELGYALKRHGVETVKFDHSDLIHDEMHGKLTAANLRMLFTDPDFLRAIDTQRGFRLSPKT